MGWNLFGGLMPPAVDTAEEKERRHSGDSGNCSEAEEGQKIELEFQLTQSLLSRVKANEGNKGANSGKQAYKDLHRMDFLVINGQAIDNSFIKGLYDKYNQENDKRLFAKYVFTEMFKHANAQVPVDPIMEELIINCNQAGYDGSLLMQLSPIFLEHTLQLPDANDRKISIICNSQDSLNIQYCPSMPVKQQDTNIEICRLDAILEFTLKSQNGKVEYEKGKVTLTIPEQLKTGRENLLDDINKYFKGADNAVVAGSPAEVDSGVDNSFDIIPKSLAFDKLVDIINKAKNGDYTNLDEVMGNIKEEKDDIPINPDLKDLKDFCSQQLNLTAQTDHERVRKVLIEKIYKKENGTVKELVLLAIAANDTLMGKFAKMHEGILFTQDEELDSLLIGAGKRCYIEFLLEHLEKELDSILFWRGICEKLKRASSIGNQECVKAILNRFEDIESRDPAISPKLLHYAVEKGYYDVVNSLIKNDANVDIQDRNGKTALHYAVSSYGYSQDVNEMVMLLVESGANIDIQDSDSKTALHYAAASSKDKIVRLLLQEGADEKIKDNSNETFLFYLGTGASETRSFLFNVLHPEGLLHHAAMEGNIDRAKRLLAKGKDVNAKNGYGKSPLSVAIEAGNLEVIKLFVSKNAVITEETIQYARDVYEKCEKDKKQAHSSVLKFPEKTSKDQFEEAIKQGNLERIKFLVEKGAVITKEIKKCAQHAYKDCQERKVYIANYPGGMKAERQNRKEILDFLEGKNSNLVNETATSNQVVDEENNNRSQNPASKNQQPQKNIVDRRENIMNNEEASIEEAIGNDCEEGKMSRNKRNTKQKMPKNKESIKSELLGAVYESERMKKLLENDNIDKHTLNSVLDEVNIVLRKKEDTKSLGVTKRKRKDDQKEKLLQTKELLEEKIESIGIDAKAAASSVNDVSATASNQVTPVSEDVLTSRSDSDSPPLSPQSPVSDEDVTDDKRGDSPLGSGSSSPIQDIVNEEEPVVIITEQPNDSEHDKTVPKGCQEDAAIKNTQPKTLVVDSKPSNTGVEGDGEKQAPVQPTEPVSKKDDNKKNAQPKPAPKPIPTSPVANGSSGQVGDTKTNGKLPNNPGNGSITATQNTQKSNWPTVATWTFAVAGILAGVAASAAYFAFSVSLLTTGIIAGVGVCCLVAAVIIYCRNRPSSSLEGSNVEPVANGKLVEQQ